MMYSVPIQKADEVIKGANEINTPVAKTIGVAGGLAFSIAFPEIAGPIVASYVFGVPSPSAPTSVGSTVVETVVNDAKSTSTIAQNAAKGKDFERVVVSDLAKEGHTNIVEQVTIKAGNGVNTRVDAVSTNTSGRIALTEAKSSSTAPLTGNQKVAFPSIAQSGGVVIGNGKPGYPGGTIIPPTQINIVRPPMVDNTYVRPVIPVIPLPKK
jgi:hypothetical protein